MWSSSISKQINRHFYVFYYLGDVVCLMILLLDCVCSSERFWCITFQFYWELMFNIGRVMMSLYTALVVVIKSTGVWASRMERPCHKWSASLLVEKELETSVACLLLAVVLRYTPVQPLTFKTCLFRPSWCTLLGGLPSLVVPDAIVNYHSFYAVDWFLVYTSRLQTSDLNESTVSNVLFTIYLDIPWIWPAQGSNHVHIYFYAPEQWISSTWPVMRSIAACGFFKPSYRMNLLINQA